MFERVFAGWCAVLLVVVISILVWPLVPKPALSQAEWAAWIQAAAGLAQGIGAIVLLILTYLLAKNVAVTEERRAISSAGVLLARLCRSLSDAEVAARTAMTREFERHVMGLERITELGNGMRLDLLPIKAAWEVHNALCLGDGFASEAMMHFINSDPLPSEALLKTSTTRMHLDEIRENFEQITGFNFGRGIGES